MVIFLLSFIPLPNIEDGSVHMELDCKLET